MEFKVPQPEVVEQINQPCFELQGKWEKYVHLVFRASEMACGTQCWNDQKKEKPTGLARIFFRRASVKLLQQHCNIVVFLYAF